MESPAASSCDDLMILANILLNLISAIFIAVIASLFSVFLALKKFKKERLWERKLEAYILIINSLHTVRVANDEAYDEELARNSYEWNNRQAHQASDEEKAADKKRWEGFREAKSDLARVLDTGKLILSSEAIEALSDNLKYRDPDADHKMHVELYDEESARIQQTITEIIGIARKDLGSMGGNIGHSGIVQKSN